jgi:hypothetical protein
MITKIFLHQEKIFTKIQKQFPYCIYIPLEQPYLLNHGDDPCYYAKTFESAYDFAINYAKQYWDFSNIEIDKIYFEDIDNDNDNNNKISKSYFVFSLEKAQETGNVWKSKSINNNGANYFCKITKSNIKFKEETILFEKTDYTEDILKIFNFTLKKLNNNIIYQDCKCNAHIYFDYSTKKYGDYLTYSTVDKKSTLKEIIMNYFDSNYLFIKNFDLIYDNIINNSLKYLDKNDFTNKHKIIFREISILYKN